MLIAVTILGVVGSYLAIGLVFAVAFVTLGVGKVDAAAHGSSVVFRLLILPGSVAFWPMLAVKWGSAAKQRGNQ